MPQVPIIIPLLVAGGFLGTVWASKELKKLWKKAIIASAVAGVLNAVHGLLLEMTASARVPATVQTTAFRQAEANGMSSYLGLTIASGLTGFLAVLLVFFSAVGIIWYRGRKQVESEAESESEQ